MAAALIARAIGEQLTCVFVDHGLLRLNEVQQVLEAFAELTDGKRPKGGILGVVIHMSMRGFLFS